MENLSCSGLSEELGCCFLLSVGGIVSLRELLGTGGGENRFYSL